VSTDVTEAPTQQPEPSNPPDTAKADATMIAAGLQRDPTEREARELAEASREAIWDRPSFAKELYLGRFDLSLIHPHPVADVESTARGEAFLEKLGAFCETLDGAVIEREAKIPDDYIKGFAELGTFGMKIPIEYGGLGLSMAYYGRGLMLAGSVHPTIGTLLSAHQSIGVPEPVKIFGTPAQKQEYLPRCATGAISAFLLTEPDVGSDPARLATTATPTEDGEAYVLDGMKLWTTNGVIAELLVVMAAVPKSDGHRGGITAFVVEADSPGITVENRNAFMGLRGIENGLTRFHDVSVPAANRLGREGEGLKIALTTLNTGRLSIPAMCAGAGKWCLKIAREWSVARVQWGKPVGKHEAVASKLSFIAATTFGLEAVLELSAQLADAGTKDIRIEAALAKLWASEMAYKIADELVQIRGGRGYETADSMAARGERAVPAEQLVRDLRINRIFEGSSEIMHLLIAREAVDTHLSAAGDLANMDADLSAKIKAGVKASGFYAKWLPKLVAGKGTVPTAYHEFGPLAKHLRFVERGSRKLARQTFYGMSRWQAKLEYRQAFLGRIVDIGAELFAMAAACTRAEMLRTQNSGARDTEQGEAAYVLADAFCAQARLRVDALFDQLWTNTDDLDRGIANQLMDDDFTWLEHGVLDQSEGTGPWIASWTRGASEKDNVARRYR
jgi:alkylation response protein AidB-like acyl-CoA dehydrogenase